MLSRRNLVLMEILNFVLNTNDKISKDHSGVIFKSLVKIKSLDQIFSVMSRLNKNSYFGIYALEFNYLLDLSLNSEEQNIDTVLNKTNRFDDIGHFKYEVMSYHYMYDKRYYDSYFDISLESFQECKREVYDCFQIEYKGKYFSNKNTIVVKKGRETTQMDIVETIFKIFKGMSLDPKLDEYVRHNYKDEYKIISHFVKLYIK
jgi:hypothetical protein